jgi:hypothetical protein
MDKIFFEIECLTEHSKPLSGEYLRKNWFRKADKRYLSQYIQKFIEYNRKYFNFLGISVFLEGSDPNVNLLFRSSEFIGAIPLRSPDTGKQIGDFIVTPRYATKDKLIDYIKILNIINKSINAQFLNSIPLVSGRNFQPPFYYEAVIFIKQLTKLVKTKWIKFAHSEELEDSPTGQVFWSKYILNAYKLENKYKFPVSKNILSEYHKEYSNVKYVFDLCKKELLSPQTPEEIKLSIKPHIYFLEEKLKFHKSITTKNIKLRQSDTLLIKKLKKQANKLLQNSFSKSIAWRVDFNDVFEKYVQHLFQQVARELGGEFYSNYKFRAYSYKKYEWELNYLEPDGIYRKGNLITVYVDAKYKSNLLNKYSQSDDLKNNFRSDLHQIIGYTSFSKQPYKFGILCYPSITIENKETIFYNPLTQTKTIINLLGIPLDTKDISKIKKLIFNILNKIEQNTQLQKA